MDHERSVSPQRHVRMDVNGGNGVQIETNTFRRPVGEQRYVFEYDYGSWWHWRRQDLKALRSHLRREIPAWYSSWPLRIGLRYAAQERADRIGRRVESCLDDLRGTCSPHMYLVNGTPDPAPYMLLLPVQESATRR